MQPRIRTRFGRLGALALSLASLSACVESSSPQPSYGGGQGGAGGSYQAPPPQQMAEPQALGLWKSNFGAVKIEEDLKTGTPGGGVLHGVWMYNRNGQDVIGYFGGRLDGNVFQFTWQEPAQPQPLVGAGYVVFEPQGQRFRGRWWTDSKDRVGEWTGWRQGLQKPDPQPQFQTDPYGRQAQPSPYGQPYGGDPYGGNGQPPPPAYPNSY